MKKVFSSLLLLLAMSCYYDNEATLYPESKCTPPASSTFSANVLPLLNNRCNNCHGGATPSGGIGLDSYTQVIKYINDGSLMGSINFRSGFSPMPKNSGKLSPCDIQKIQVWIDSGALNN